MLTAPLLLLAGVLHHAPPPQPAVEPIWDQRPRLEAHDYPPSALSQLISGSAIVRCRFHPSGTPTDCHVESETPEGFGFGAAAVRVVGRGRLDPASLEGMADGATFTVRIVFSVG